MTALIVIGFGIILALVCVAAIMAAVLDTKLVTSAWAAYGVFAGLVVGALAMIVGALMLASDLLDLLRAAVS